jgi:hypothetical protein
MTGRWSSVRSRATVEAFGTRTDDVGEVVGEGGTVSSEWESTMLLRVVDQAYSRAEVLCDGREAHALPR